MESALSEGCRRTGEAELHRVTLGVGRHNSLGVVAEVVHIAGLEEEYYVAVGYHVAVGGIVLGAVVLRTVAVGEDTLAAVDLG